MERIEKGVGERRGGKGEKQEELMKLRKKLKPGMVVVGKRAGPSTPSPIWRLDFSSLNRNKNSNNNTVQEFLNTASAVSARKLCANLWEVQPQLHHPSLAKMKGVRRGHHKGKKAVELPTHLVEPPSTLPAQAVNASALRTHVEEPLVMKNRQSVERNDRALKCVSPASHSSSMEVAPYNREVTPTWDFKRRMGESSYSLKTSTELLKVLNRIWSLEEQQTSNISVLKALKMELDHSQLEIKQLLKEKEMLRREMDGLMKQVAEDKVIRKTKEQDRIKAAIQSVQEELEDERKLRKHSEILHRKLGRELCEVKSSFSDALKELERERKARILLESLCDEFAKGIRDYERELRSLSQRTEVDRVGRETPDRFILHISEAWLDERMQMKVAEAHNDRAGKNSIVDKLSLDIETFLQARHSIGFRKDNMSPGNEAINNYSRRESFPLNEAVSAPRDAVDEGDSADSDSHCFELKSASRRQNTGSCKRQGNHASESHLEGMVGSNGIKSKIDSNENNKIHNLSSLPAQFDEHLARSKTQFPGGDDSESKIEDQAARTNSGTSDIYDDIQEVLRERSKRSGSHGFKSSLVLDNLIRNHSLSSEGDKIYPEDDLKEGSHVRPMFTGHASPVQQWMSKLGSPEFEKSESSLKLPKGLKETTLKAKLLEARLESQRSRSKASKGSS